MNGNQQWSQLYNGTANATDQANAIVIDSIGSVYVTGLSWGGVTNFDIATIKYSAPLSVSIIATNATCNGASNGSASAVVMGGISPYTYQWNNGQTTQNITALAAGTYALIVTDSLNNTVSEIINITEPPIDTLVNSASCKELFISEYVEGITQSKALEFYNPSEDTILLNNYFVRVFMNGAPTPLITQLLGVLFPKQTHIIANPNADAAILAKANQTSNKINFNGDDAIQFVKVLNVININIDSIENAGGNPHDIFDTLQLDTIDQIGITNVYPGNQGWAVGSSGSTKNSTLIRNHGVTSGISDNWSCGQYQWQIKQQNDIADLGQHQNICAASNKEIFFSFDNPAQTTDTVTGFNHFEFDIMVNASDTGTYLGFALFKILYDTLSFGAFITGNGKLMVTNGSSFNIPAYNPQQLNDISNNIFQFLITATDSLNKTHIPTTPIQLYHIKIKIDSCFNNSGISFTDTANTALFSRYTTSANANSTQDLPYDTTHYSMGINLVLCQLNIFSFTSPVYPGTYYAGTTTSEWQLTIDGIGFGAAKGNGNVYFPDADTNGIYLPLNANDFISWSDNQILIRMPSVVDSFYINGNLKKHTPASGIFYVKTNNGDSVLSAFPIDMPYAIKNTLDPLATGGKIRLDLVNVSPSDSVAITFRLGTSITNHPNPMAEVIVRKAIKDWRCEALVYFEVGNDTTINTTVQDNVSVIYFTNSLSSGILGETQIYAGVCGDINSNKIVFPKETDIALGMNNPWFFDTTGLPLPANMYDFYEVILHEVGHAALLVHKKATTVPGNNQELMYWEALVSPVQISGLNRRYIGFDDQAGTLFDVVPRSNTLNLNTPTCISSNVGTLILPPGQSCATLLGVHNLSIQNNFTIFPNPVNDNFTVEFEIGSNANVEFSIYDYTGKEISRIEKKQMTKGKHQEQINTQPLTTGLYLFVANINGLLKTIKIIKM